MPLLDTLIAIGPIPLVAAAAAILAVLLLRRRRPDADAGGPPPGRLARVAARPVTDADRALAASMLTDMVRQVRHGEDMEARRGHEAVVVRLVPQIPIRAHAPRSWLGGAPALPDGTPWPQVEGRPAMFLAQICCADLPADLWDGLGPRGGWLAFFLDGESFAMTVLHLAACGPLREGPPPHDTVFCPALGLRYAKHGAAGTRAFPRWPVDLVAVRPGTPDPRIEGGESPTRALYAAGYDLAAPEHRPFDWPSTLAMLDILEQRIAGRGDAPTPSPLAAQLEKARAMLAAADPVAMPAADLARLRNRVHDLPVLIDATNRARALWQAAIPAVEAIAARVRRRAAQVPFSEAEIAPVMAELQALTWMHVHRGSDPARGPGAEDIRCRTLPLTVHEAGATLWAHEFETVRFDLAKHAYAGAPEALPTPVRAFYEALWPAVAAREIAGMGHVPFKYVHVFDPQTEVTLLELPSSDLMSWMFGDVDNLVVTMAKADLAAGTFGALRVQVSN